MQPVSMMTPVRPSSSLKATLCAVMGSAVLIFGTPSVAQTVKLEPWTDERGDMTGRPEWIDKRVNTWLGLCTRAKSSQSAFRRAAVAQGFNDYAPGRFFKAPDTFAIMFSSSECQCSVIFGASDPNTTMVRTMGLLFKKGMSPVKRSPEYAGQFKAAGRTYDVMAMRETKLNLTWGRLVLETQGACVP